MRTSKSHTFQSLIVPIFDLASFWQFYNVFVSKFLLIY